MPLSPRLETNRLFLRPLNMKDVEAHQKYFVDWEIVRTMGSRMPWPYPHDESVRFIEQILSPSQADYYWAITLKEHGDEMIGMIKLHPLRDYAHRGFWLARPFQNRGIMTEACMVTNDFWFNSLNKDVMVVENAVGNIASSKIKEKTGAVKIATFPNAGNYIDPAFDTTEQWLLTRTAWRNFKSAR